jgi:phage terminase large subunit-like protein
VSVLVVPVLEETPWPTLGPLVCAWIERNLVHGPGDLRGKPARIDPEKRALIYRMYEVYPQEHALAGRRRFKRVAISLRKGTAKTELAAWLAAVELHHEGPVRCIGWDAAGQPIGGPVTDPYIPLVAYTEEQSEDLAYGALKVILELSPIANDFDIGEERIMRVRGDGKAVPLASAPSARDGARTTFQHFDETHRFILARLRNAHTTMLANIPKRKLADAWSLETTTSPAPGERSVAEGTMQYAGAVADGRVLDSRLFFFHRQASDEHDLTTPEGLRAAVLEASGPAAEWTDIEGIVGQWQDPQADFSYLERVWLNRPVKSAERAFDVELFKARTRRDYVIPDGALVGLGFDGSKREDSTAIVATEISTGFQQVAAKWERPFGQAGDGWEVSQLEVEAAMATCFERWNVWRLYADPPYWESTVATWTGTYGDERVVSWLTRLWRKTADAIRGFVNAIADRELTHDGDPAYVRHVGNAFKRPLPMRAEDGKSIWIIQKERNDSPNKIDITMAGILSWQARCDAIAEGVGNEPENDYTVERLEDDEQNTDRDDDVAEQEEGRLA